MSPPNLSHCLSSSVKIENMIPIPSADLHGGTAAAYRRDTVRSLRSTRPASAWGLFQRDFVKQEMAPPGMYNKAEVVKLAGYVWHVIGVSGQKPWRDTAETMRRGILKNTTHTSSKSRRRTSSAWKRTRFEDRNPDILPSSSFGIDNSTAVSRTEESDLVRCFDDMVIDPAVPRISPPSVDATAISNAIWDKFALDWLKEFQLSRGIRTEGIPCNAAVNDLRQQMEALSLGSLH